jgi:hypothetical protein
VAVVVINTADGTQSYSSSPNVTDVVSGTLEGRPRWTADGQGGNVGVIVPGSAWSTTGDYEVGITIETDNAGPVRLVWRVEAS